MSVNTMEKKTNEQDACERFIEILKSLTGLDYKVLESPDQSNRSTPDVDFLLASSGDENNKIAVEHTKVHSFDGQIEYLNRSWDIVSSVNERCRGKIPDRYYYLAIPPVLVDSLMTKGSREQCVSYLSSWVMETAPTQLLEDSHRETEYEGHRITLGCIGDCGKLNGNVGRMPQQPASHKDRQRERLRRAVSAKLPKLRKYEKGFKTALLLEDVAGTLEGSTLSGYEGLDEVDYVVVFVSNEERMITGNVWKERAVWYPFVPSNRRFKFRRTLGNL